MTYDTKEEAIRHISSKPAVAAKQRKMIDSMYACNLKVTQADLDGIDYDCHCDTMRKAMSY